MKLDDLIKDCGTGQLSSSKVWTHIVYFIVTLAFIRFEIFGMSEPNLLLWMVYLGFPGGHAVASKVASLKFGKMG